MTDLQMLYMKARTEGKGHRAAVAWVARRTGLDAGTVARCLHRARRTDERDDRVRKAATS